MLGKQMVAKGGRFVCFFMLFQYCLNQMEYKLQVKLVPCTVSSIAAAPFTY